MAFGQSTGNDDSGHFVFSLFFPFLAVMSSSRSDDVTKFVRVSVVIFFSLEHSKHLKQDV